MTVLLVILALLIVPYLLLKPFGVPPTLRGRIGLSQVFLFTGLGHFIKTSEMMQMLPSWVPSRELLVYVTGLLEWLFAVALLIPKLTGVTGWIICAFLIAVFPANVHAALQRVEFGGHEAGPTYLLVRLPLQLLLIGWTYWFAIRPTSGFSRSGYSVPQGEEHQASADHRAPGES
jgi:uncharacterized membrane protein